MWGDDGCLHRLCIWEDDSRVQPSTARAGTPAMVSLHSAADHNTTGTQPASSTHSGPARKQAAEESFL